MELLNHISLVKQVQMHWLGYQLKACLTVDILTTEPGAHIITQSP